MTATSDLVIIDFGQGIAGPYCGQLLADDGGTVIKVEPPRGDWSRHMGAHDTESGMSGPYYAVNRNKHAITLDLSHEPDCDVARRLVQAADIVVESFRPGVMDRWNLGFDAVAELNPRIIYASVTGFGTDGPNSSDPAGDSTMQAYGGLMSIVGSRGGPPLRVGNVVSDMVAGVYAYAGILRCLAERAWRDAHGLDDKPEWVRTSLLESILAFQAVPISEYLFSGSVPARQGEQHPMLSPSGVYETKDGFLMMTVLNHQWERFCHYFNLDHLLADSRFDNGDLRLQNREELNAVIRPIFAAMTRDEALAELHQADVLCAPINDYESLRHDPQVQSQHIFIDVADAPRPLIKNPIAIGDEVRPVSTPPKLDQDRDFVLSWLKSHAGSD